MKNNFNKNNNTKKIASIVLIILMCIWTLGAFLGSIAFFKTIKVEKANALDIDNTYQVIYPLATFERMGSNNYDGVYTFINPNSYLYTLTDTVSNDGNYSLQIEGIQDSWGGFDYSTTGDTIYLSESCNLISLFLLNPRNYSMSDFTLFVYDGSRWISSTTVNIEPNSSGTYVFEFPLSFSTIEKFEWKVMPNWVFYLDTIDCVKLSSDIGTDIGTETNYIYNSGKFVMPVANFNASDSSFYCNDLITQFIIKPVDNSDFYELFYDFILVRRYISNNKIVTQSIPYSVYYVRNNNSLKINSFVLGLSIWPLLEDTVVTGMYRIAPSSGYQYSQSYTFDIQWSKKVEDPMILFNANIYRFDIGNFDSNLDYRTSFFNYIQFYCSGLDRGLRLSFRCDYYNSSNYATISHLRLPLCTYYLNLENTNPDYDLGYSNGYINGVTSGYNDGYNAGDSAGYDRGYNIGNNVGYNRGIQSANDYSFLGLFGAIIDAPIQAFSGLLDFNILGYNVKSLYLGLIVAGITLAIVKKVMGG